MDPREFLNLCIVFEHKDEPDEHPRYHIPVVPLFLLFLILAAISGASLIK